MAVRASASIDLASVSDGERGFSILKITTAPSTYTTKVDTFTPACRILLSTVKSQSSATEVLVGDVLQYSYYQYKVGYVDASYVYTAAPTSLRGATGAAGQSVTKVEVAYGLSTSNASDGYSEVTSWTTDIPDWTSGSYIWQRSITTVGTTAKTPVYALYGAFNSLATTVAGHTTQISQQGEAIELRATKADVETAKTDAVSTAKSYADAQIKVASDSITSTVASTYETKDDAATTKTQVTQNADSISTLVSRADATDTLIRETSDGIEVGKSTDGSTYSGYHTLVGTDSFQIHDASHKDVFHIQVQNYSSAPVEIRSPQMSALRLISGGDFDAAPTEMGVDETKAWMRLRGTDKAKVTLGVMAFTDDMAYLDINLNGGSLYLGGIAINGFPTDAGASDITKTYAQIVSLLKQTSGVATNTAQINSGSVYWTRNGCMVTGYCYLNVKYYQSTWAESPAWATGLPNNTTNGTNRCGFFRHDCNNGTSELIVTSSGELKCQRRGDEITAGTNICGFFCYPTY